MNKLFIYYSLTGNGDTISKYLEKQCDLRKVNVKKELPNSLFLKMMVGGFKAFIGYKEKLINFDNNIDSYDEIIIGSPIWNDRLSSPIRTVLNKINLNNKNITFILYSGSGEAKKATEFINDKYKNVNILYLKEPNKNKNELDKLKI